MINPQCSSLMLHLNTSKRLSIDIDIICHDPHSVSTLMVSSRLHMPSGSHRPRTSCRQRYDNSLTSASKRQGINSGS